MKRKSFVITFLVLFWIGYVAISLLQFASDVKSFSTQHIENKKEQVDFQLDNAAHFLVVDQIEALNDRLQKAFQLKQFNFYLLRQNENVMGFANKDNQLDKINFDYKIFNEFRDTGKVIFKTIRISDYKLTIGFNSDLTGFVFEELSAHKQAILRDLAIVSIFILALIYIVMKDILDLNRILISGQRQHLDKVKIMSKEGEVLLKTSLGYEEEHRLMLNLENQLSESVGSAIAEEVRLGTKAPSTFMATLVRVDLNGYTQLFLEKNEEYVTSILNTYFEKAHELIHRYNGRVYQHIGDEIIVIIKDSPVAKSEYLALGLVRGLFNLANEMESTVTSKYHHSFKIKSSFVYGKMRFVHLDKGYSFTGLPLIESVRMLSNVTEKEENTLVFYKNEEEFFNNMCISHQEQNVIFKGFAEEKTLSLVQKFNVDASEKLNIQDQILYLRETSDIAAILKKISTNIQNEKLDGVVEQLKKYSLFQIYIGSHEILDSYKKLLKACLDLKTKNEKVDAITATGLMIGMNVVSRSVFDTDLENLLLEFVNNSDSRVAANAIEVLGHFKPQADIFKMYFESPINRLAANSLIIEGKKSIDKSIVKNIKKLLSSDKPFFIASGLYVISVLSEYHYKNNYVYYRSSPELNELKSLVTQYIHHESDIVRKRAELSQKLTSQLKVAA